MFHFFLHHGKGGLLSVLHQMSIISVHCGDWTQVGGQLFANYWRAGARCHVRHARKYAIGHES